jgi:hypothetical protein
LKGLEMAPADPTATIRYKVSYTGPFGTHKMLFHGVDGTTLDDLRDAVASVIAPMVGSCWNTTTFNIGEFALVGNTFYSIDVSWVTQTRTSSTNPGVNDAPSHFAQWGARSTGSGRRAKWYLFETAIRDNDTMRYQAADNADVGDVVDALVAADGVIGVIDGTLMTVYQYANVGQNDHLTHKARS